jgi:hypothetical protein
MVDLSDNESEDEEDSIDGVDALAEPVLPDHQSEGLTRIHHPTISGKHKPF